MGGLENIDTKSQLVLTLITCAPSGTLGDVSSCKKYIEETLASLPADSKINTRFNLVVTNVVDSATKKRIKALLGENIQYNLIIESDVNNSFFSKPELKNSDAFIFYPSFQITPNEHIRAIKSLNKPVLIVNHYNFESSTDKRYAAKKEQWMPSLYTGFGPDSLGVNIKDLGTRPANINIPKDDADIYNLVFNTGSTTTLTEASVQEYSEKRTLFFGYMNKLGYVESKRNLANPTDFARACISKSQKQNPGKNIDVLIRLNDKTNDSADFNYYNQLVDHFKKDNAGLTVAIYKKDDSGRLVLKDTFGDGATKVRIIDPFPISNDSMINMMQLSDPFSMMTGSESFIESLSCNKLPLYQIMHWHDRLYNELLKEIKSIDTLGADSLLYQYFALQDKTKGTIYEQLVEFLCKNETQLLEQLQVFKQHLLDNKQLRSRLHNRITELAGDSEKYIHQCLDMQHIVDFNDEPELNAKVADLPKSIVQLYAMFPKNRETICQDSAKLLTEIAKHDSKGAKKIIDFVKGYRQFGNTKAFNLFPDIFRLVTDPEVQQLIIKAELKYFSSQLNTVYKAVEQKHSPDTKQFTMAMEQLDVINNARKELIQCLLYPGSPEDKGKAMAEFHKKISVPVFVIDRLLEKNFLLKALDCLFKSICAVLGLPVIAIMATTKSGRQNLNNFFSLQTEGQREINKLTKYSDDAQYPDDTQYPDDAESDYKPKQ